MAAAVYNPFENAQEQFDKVAALLELDSGIRELLRQPMQEIHFTIPVKMDDGSTKVFKAYRIRHNDARGPAGLQKAEFAFIPTKQLIRYAPFPCG